MCSFYIMQLCYIIVRARTVSSWSLFIPIHKGLWQLQTLNNVTAILLVCITSVFLSNFSKISQTIFYSKRESDHPYVGPDLGGNASNFLPCTMMLAVINKCFIVVLHVFLLYEILRTCFFFNI